MAHRKKHYSKRVNIDQAFVFFCQPTDEGKLKTHEDVAKHFDLNKQLISKWSSKYQWSERRKEWGKELLHDAKMVILDQIESATHRHLKNYVDLEAFAVRILQEQLTAFEGKASGKTKFSVWSVSEAAKVLKDAINGQRVILGLPTEVAKADLTTTNRNLDLPVDQAKEFDDFILQNGTKKPLLPILNSPAHQ